MKPSKYLVTSFVYKFVGITMPFLQFLLQLHLYNIKTTILIVMVEVNFEVVVTFEVVVVEFNFVEVTDGEVVDDEVEENEEDHHYFILVIRTIGRITMVVVNANSMLPALSNMSQLMMVPNSFLHCTLPKYGVFAMMECNHGLLYVPNFCIFRKNVAIKWVHQMQSLSNTLSIMEKQLTSLVPCKHLLILALMLVFGNLPFSLQSMHLFLIKNHSKNLVNVSGFVFRWFQMILLVMTMNPNSGHMLDIYHQIQFNNIIFHFHHWVPHLLPMFIQALQVLVSLARSPILAKQCLSPTQHILILLLLVLAAHHRLSMKMPSHNSNAWDSTIKIKTFAY
mmetsp:Transcript_15560/g.23334  ORF Transcript_15560/g.23334 Transcript_15560/m.23334 type:complete len:336 (+) Transcript_15560:298-1305(+)